MLQAIRDRAQGWIAWAIVIIISIPFALWGIQEYLGVGSEPVVAEVNGEELTERDLERRARDFRENLRLTLGSAYRPDLISEEDLRAQVLHAMIDERVLLDAARDWGMRAGDELVRGFIQAIPGFQQDGRFSQGLYDTALRNRGMSPPMFEDSVRRDIVLRQLRDAVRGSAFVTQREVAEAARLEHQQRRLAYVVIPAEPFAAEVAVADAELEAFYREQAAQFLVPEKVSVQYLLVELAALAERVTVDERQLEQYYDQHTLEFRAPEQRRMRHILVALPAGADRAAEAEALAQAEVARQRLADGEAFAAVAAEVSGDPGSASNGGDLGWVEPGMMVAPFEEAAFELAPGEVSEPVRTQFGYHLIEVTEVRASAESDFASVRDKVEAALRRAEAENVFYDFVERLAELSFENPGSLAPAAEALDLEVRTTEPFSRADPPAELQHPKAVNAAFSAEVIERGNNSELLELGPDRAMVLRVLAHEAEHLRPLDEVRDEVTRSYRSVKAAEAAAAAGQAALEALGGGQSLTSLAEAKGWKPEQLDGVRRDDTRLPAALATAAFGLAPPAPGGASRGGTPLGNDYGVVEVYEVLDADIDSLSDNDRRLVRSRLENRAQSGDYASFQAALREAADIEVFSSR